MKIGYTRVSTGDQNPTLQLAAFKRERYKRIFIDKASGVIRKRPELDKCLKSLKPGDVLIVWKLDRLGRSLRDLVTLLDDLKGQRIKFKSLTEAIDTETPTFDLDPVQKLSSPSVSSLHLPGLHRKPLSFRGDSVRPSKTGHRCNCHRSRARS